MRKSLSENLSDNFVENLTKAYGSKVFHVLRLVFLGDQGDVGVVDFGPYLLCAVQNRLITKIVVVKVVYLFCVLTMYGYCLGKFLDDIFRGDLRGIGVNHLPPE